MTFEEIYKQLPKEIIDDNKHYVLSITPYDVSYLAYNEEKKYILYKVTQSDLSIKDETERLLDNLKRMLEITQKANA